MDRAEHQLLKCIQIAPACPRVNAFSFPSPLSYIPFLFLTNSLLIQYIQVYAGFMAAMAEKEPQFAKEYIDLGHLFSIRAQVVKLLRKGEKKEDLLVFISYFYFDLLSKILTT